MSLRKNKMLKLILPVIFPSWRFFSSIGASPRIQFAFLQNESDNPQLWQEFRPLPERVSFVAGLRRLLWNPQWNETLYINTCAEHLFDESSPMRVPMREQEIMRRVLAAVSRGEVIPEHNAAFLLFRICTVIRDGNKIMQPVVFVSKPVALLGNAL